MILITCHLLSIIDDSLSIHVSRDINYVRLIKCHVDIAHVLLMTCYWSRFVDYTYYYWIYQTHHTNHNTSNHQPRVTVEAANAPVLTPPAELPQTVIRLTSPPKLCIIWRVKLSASASSQRPLLPRKPALPFEPNPEMIKVNLSVVLLPILMLTCESRVPKTIVSMTKPLPRYSYATLWASLSADIFGRRFHRSFI